MEEFQVIDVPADPARSFNMSRIRGRNTKPELQMRRALHGLGLRFRLHRRNLPGTPDIVLPRWRAVVEVRGCFWHRHTDCRYATSPKSNVEFWNAKFAGNIERDQRSLDLLNASGWRAAIVWECSIRREGAEPLSRRILDWLSNGADNMEF